mgnify:CR=1 FL=1
MLPEREATETHVRTEAALRWLAANPGWFLILDNIDSDDALQAAHTVLRRLSGGHVVITSRLTDLPPELEALELDVLELADAARYLLEASANGRVKRDDDAAMAVSGG